VPGARRKWKREPARLAMPAVRIAVMDRDQAALRRVHQQPHGPVGCQLGCRVALANFAAPQPL
jgi:hypothetical protein